MSDLIGVNDTLPVRLGGVSSSSGLPDNYADVISTGQLKVAISDASGNALNSTSNALNVFLTNSTVAVTQSTSPWVISGTVTANQGTANATPWNINVADFGGSVVVTGTGASGAGIPRVTVSNDSNILATQSGTWTVQPGNTANTTAWFVKDNSLGTVAAGTAGTQSSLAGGVFNTALPTLTNGQQAALQLDSSGRLIVSPSTSASVVSVSNLPTTVDTNYGTVGATTLRTASQIGNATGAADFAAGNSSAQTLRVVIATNQLAVQVQGDSASGAAKAGNPVQIGGVFNTTQPTVTTGQTVEAQMTARGAQIVSTGVDAFNITNISGTISLPTGAATSALQTTGNTSLATIATNTANLTVAQASTTSGQTGQLVQGAVTTNPPAYTTGQTDPFSLTITGDLRSADICNTAGQYRAQSVTTTAAEALGAASILVNRKSLTITPTNGTVYWGFSNAVTTTTGQPIFKNQSMSFAVGANLHVYVISAGTVDCRIAEGS